MGRVQAAALLLAGLASVARAQAPRIDSLDPAQGPIAGGTTVTVSGSGFAGASVTLDGTPIAPLSVSDAQIRIPMPPHDNGYALILVSVAAQSAAAEFLYVPPKLQDLPPGHITTVAGVGVYSAVNLPAKDANVQPFGLCIDPLGRIYLASPGRNIIQRIRPDGILEPFAGQFPGPNGQSSGDGGPASKALLGFPRACAVDGAGNVYTGEDPSRVRRVDAKTGIIATVAGTGIAGLSGDGGPAVSARVAHPSFLAAEPDGTVYFIDAGNARIRRIGPDGIISTVAGNGTTGDSGDGGPATAAQIEDTFQPIQGPSDGGALAVDPGKLLYLAETASGRVRRIDLRTGIITTFATLPPNLYSPRALTVDRSGNVFVGYGDRIVEFSSSGQTIQSWGVPRGGFSEDGTPIAEVRFAQVAGLAIDSSGNVVFSEIMVGRVQRLDFQTGKVENLAGNAPRLKGVPGPAVSASFYSDYGDLAFLPSGDLLFGLTEDLRILRIGRDGAISAFGGTGTQFGASPGNEAPISTVAMGPIGLESDLRGGFYYIDSGGSGVLRVDAGGRTERFAGDETKPGYAGDGGPASDALLTQTWDLALDRGGNVFIADTNNNRIRRVDKLTGIITTVAGGGPLNGFEGYGHGAFCGDGGPAIDACFNTPYALTVDPDGNIFVYDSANGRIRKVDAQGTISTFAVDQPVSGKIVSDGSGGLFVNAFDAIKRYLPDGTSWAVAGSPGRAGFSGDGGPARDAKVWTSTLAAGIAIDSEGDLLFHDATNRRIRAVRFGAVLAPPNAQVMATLGDGQSASAATAFASPLEVTVKTEGGIPAPGVRVDFVAPSSGPHGVFANGLRSISVLTDRSGKAQATCSASCQAGAYAVTATALGSTAQVRFTLTNTSSRRRCTMVVPPR